ncbi:hybrid sensor histidine kinase/response regulator [Desulfogranum marinum]|uniref:hybrid sensor histidine kinase/response regulator n=1 Tax=Desulfogranum marinum TaxID=453220 RepID=UPI0019637231|nr:response regulator [Desulfogranum marinum]MBM9513526.1 response regulator [Desulfogranum marinum]
MSYNSVGDFFLSLLRNFTEYIDLSYRPAFVTGGLTIVIILLILLFVLNYRNKKVIFTKNEELKKAEARYHLIFEQSPISLWEEDLSEVKSYIDDLQAEGVQDFGLYFEMHPEALRVCADKIKVTDVNARTLDLYEIDDKNDLSGIKDILPQGSEWIIKEEILGFLDCGSFDVTISDRTLSGRNLTIELRAVVAAGYEQNWEKVYASVIDITEQTQLKQEKKEYEKQIQQTQKLEAIGSLAGGIAHDFNNILSPIMGRAELMLLEAGNNEVMQEHCHRILDASKRARDLVRQILTFSREVKQEIRPVSMEKVIEEVMQLIRPILPATITLAQEIPANLPLVMADTTQLHQVIMNLITNGFHAMENIKGTLQLELSEVFLGVDDCDHETLSPGRYLCLTVADTGHGMDTTTIDKIFDPYFSTKARNKGTGLGLSVVHGILRGYGGGIRVTSEVGKGTTFFVYLPVIEMKKKSSTNKNVHGPIPRGDEHILLVDDEKSVAEVTKNMLERMGYKVTMRVSSLEALEAFRNLHDRIDLVITDLTMPHFTGLQLLARVRQINDQLPVIVTTGFSEQLDIDKSSALGVNEYLAKPVLMEDLGRSVRSVLDEVKTGMTYS